MAPYPAPGDNPAAVNAQLVINQGATLRTTITCDLTHYGIVDIGAWAVQGGTFTIATAFRGEADYQFLVAGAVAIVGNNATIELTAAQTDALTDLNGRFTVEASDGTDNFRLAYGGWRLHRTTDNGSSAAALATTLATFPSLSNLNANSPLGVLPYLTLPGVVHVGGQGFGYWKVQSNTGTPTTSPERLSALYRTRVNITFSGSIGVAPIVNDIVTHSLGWTARVFSVGAGVATLSLWTGTALDGGLNSLEVSPGNGWTGVSVGTFSGATTGYQATVTAGVFAPRAPAPAGIYNCVGSRQDTANGLLFPYQPENYDLTFMVPPETFGEGAVLEVFIAGVIKNSIPLGDNPKLHTTLAIGSSIFREAELDIEAPAWMRFESPVLPAIASETPFLGTFRVHASRKGDYTQGQIALFTGEMDSAVYGGAGAYRSARQRGSDKIVAPASSPGFELEDGNDAVNKRCARNVAIWIAVSPEFNTGVPGNELYCIIHSYQWRIGFKK